MNLSYVHKLLVAADQQRHGFLRIRDRQADQQVRLMAGAGLVDATLSNGKDESFTAINRLTDLGRTFLRTFKDRPIPAPALLPPRTQTGSEWQLDCQGAVVEKGNVNFALDLRPPERAD
jgi:hypothetical protein